MLKFVDLSDASFFAHQLTTERSTDGLHKTVSVAIYKTFPLIFQKSKATECSPAVFT